MAWGVTFWPRFESRMVEVAGGRCDVPPDPGSTTLRTRYASVSVAFRNAYLVEMERTSVIDPARAMIFAADRRYRLWRCGPWDFPTLSQASPEPRVCRLRVALNAACAAPLLPHSSS